MAKPEERIKATKINGFIPMDKDTARAYYNMIERGIVHMQNLWMDCMSKEKRRYIESLQSKLSDAKDIADI